jgi:hypothetical protein
MKRAAARTQADRHGAEDVSLCRDDAKARERLRALARLRRRFGYRRLLILLRREGIELNHKKLFRLSRMTVAVLQQIRCGKGR